MSTYKPHKPTFAFNTEEVDANPIEPTLGVAPTIDVEKPDEDLLERIKMERSLREMSLGDPIGRIRDDLRKKGINPVSTDYVRDATDKAVKAREFFETVGKTMNEEGYIDLTQPVTNIANFDKRVDQYISSGLAEEVKDASGRRVGIKMMNNSDISPMIDSAYSTIKVPEAMSDVAQSDYFSELTRNVISQLPVNDKGEIEYNGVPYHWSELYEAFYPVVADRAHETLINSNKDYYNWAFEQSMGMSYEDWYKGYADKRVSEIEQKIIELRDAVAEETAQIAEGEGREVALSSGTLVPALLLGWASKEGARVEASKQFNDVLESINTFRNNDFKSGLNEGFDWVDALTLGIADLGTSYSQLQLLEKAKRGEPLSNSESKVLELLQLTQEFEGIKKSLGWERNLRSSVGSGLGSTLAMAPSFALGMAGTSRIGTTVKLAANVVKNASKKAALKQVGKSFIHNLGTSLGRGAAVAPLMPSTYSTGLKELQEQYTFNPDGTIKFEPKSKALAFMGGYIDTMSEYASEVFGSTLGEIIGYGARAFGRVTRLNKVVDAVMEPVNTGLGKAIDKGLSYIPIEDEAKLAGLRKALRGMIVPNAELDEETKELMRMWGVQDGYVAEAASEVFGDLMSQVMRDIVGAKTDYSDFKDSTYWGTQLLVSVLYGGSMNTLAHIKEGVSDYQQLVDLGKYKKDILDKIESRELRNKVLAITADGSIEDMAKQLADIEWEKYHATDRAKVMDYIRAEMQIQVTAGNVEENGRVEAFVKEAARLSGVTYQGKGGQIMETTVGGRQYYIIDGKPADRSDSSMLTCIDKETGERKAILSKSLPEQPVTRTYNEVLQDVYKSRFSVDAEATRISALQSAYGQMERPTAEVARDMMKQMGITPPVEGDVITMSDGRKATITQDLENGSYVVRLEGQVPLLFTIPFYSIQSSNPLTAEAQKRMIEGKVGSAVNKAADVSAVEVEKGDVTEEAITQPTQDVTSTETTEAEMQSAETMAQTEEQIANDTLDMTNVPTDAEGNIDFDAIDDPVQYAALYEREAGSKAEAARETEDLKSKTLEAAAKLEEQSKNEITASAKRKKLNEAKKLRERAAFYDKVLPEFEEMEEEYTSVVKNEYSQQVAEPTMRVLDAMAKKLGLKVRFVDEVRTASGEKANANINGNEVEIAFMERIKSIAFLMGHEFTHRMQDLSPEQYEEFKQMVKDFVGEEKWNALVAQTAQAYAKQNVPFTEALIEDEVTADAAGELVESNDAFLKYLEGKKEDKTFLMKVAEFLRDMVTMFNTANDRERERQYLGLLDGVNKLIESAASAEATSNGQRERFSFIGEQVSAEELAEIEAERQSIIETAKANGTYLKAPNGKDTNLTPEQWVNVRTSRFKKWFGDWENDPRNASKIVDENGEPMVMIHGSPYTFTTFRRGTTDGGGSGRGIYFARAPKDASNYAYGGENSKKYFVFLNVRNLYDTDLMSVVRKYKAREFGLDDKKRRIPEEVMYAIIGASSYDEFIKNTQDSRFNTYKATIENISETTFNKIHSFFDGKGIFSSTPVVKKRLFRKDDAYLALTHDFIGEIVVRDPNQIKSATDNVGTYSAANDDIRYSLIGEQGASALDMAEEATIRMDNLAIAREMEERGDSALNIRMATGWERGADGLWRYEIEENIPKDFFTKNLDVETTLGEILGDSHQYFKAYPSLADIKVLFSSMSYNEAGMYGGYNPINRSLLMFNSGENLETFVHEIQHAIQIEEGFAIGGGEENFRFEGDTGFRQGQQYIPMSLILENKTRKYVGKETTIKYGINSGVLDILDKEGLKESYKERKNEIPEIFHATLEDIINNPDIISREQAIPIIQKVVDEAIAKAKDAAHAKYKRIAGEVESRNVEHRLNMTPEERRATLLSKTEDVAREDQIFLREGAEMAIAKNVGLPKEEYAKLASTIMTRQHTYGRPPFDYAFTDGSFYVYDYLGDGDSIINFAMPIVGNEDLIQNITNSIDNGTITDTRSLDLYAENLQGKQRVNYRRFADAFKKRHGNRGYGVTFRGDSASNGGTYFEDSKRIGGDATTRGTSGSIDESANQELTTRFSLITPEMDASTSAPAAETQTITTSNGDMVADVNEATGQGRFSLRTYREGGRDVLADFLDTRVSDGALTEREASEMMQQMDDIYNLCMAMEDEYTPFGMWSEAKVMADENGNPVFSVIKANGDYAMNLDFSLVCKKRRTLDAVLNEMVKRGMIKGVSQKDTTIAKINEVIRKYGFETACALCFVDARRFQILRTARNFCNLYNDIVNLLIPKKRNIPVNEFNFAGRTDVSVAENSLDTMSDEALNVEAVRKIGYKVVGKTKDGKDIYAKTVLAKVARHLVEHPEDRRYLSPSDFVSTRGFDHVKQMKPLIMKLYNAKKGTGGPKAAYSDTQYLNDIIRSNWNVKDAYAVGGVRLQSFSDYVPRMVFDYIQMVAELAAKELPVHAYTKEPLFAKTFGLTGMKINLSLVPDVVEGGVAAGLDADGNYVWKQGETFPYEEAIALQDAEGYRDNCGTIAVGVSDAHILKMLDDPNIRMVIPYHKSGLPKQVAQMNNVSAFVDYTKVQNTTKNGVALTKEEAAKVPNYNELLREHKDARKAAKAYLDWCAERGYTPKFAQFASHPNYYKLLEDFTTMVNDRYVPQGAVTFTFPTKESAFGSLESLIEQGLEEDAVLEGMRDARVGAIVDEVGDVLGVKSEARYSIIGEIGAANLDTYGRYGSPMLALELAREFEAEGKSAKDIRLATNWERGKDGKWRYEIMDGVYNHPQDDDITAKEYRLADILDNPDLYKAYPYLKDLKVTYNAELKPNGRYNGKSIELKSTRTPEQINSTLIHEVQHAIQYAEMFARGGTIASVTKELVTEGKQLAEEFKNTSNVDIIRKGYLLYQIAKKAWDIVKEDSKASEAYRSLAGEVEARNAQKRMDMTEEQRLETLLSATEDVSRDAQRMLFYEAKGGAEDARYSIINDMTEEDAYQASLLEEAMRMEREATSNGMDIAQEIADRTGWVHLANGEWKYYGEGKLEIPDKASAERAAFRWLESKKAVKVEQVRKIYTPLIKAAENKDAKAQIEYERDAALAEIEAEYKEIFEDFDNNPDTYIREHQEAESYNANLDMYVGSLTKARKEVERLERQQAKRKLSDEEKMAAMRAVKAAVAKELRDGLGRYTRKYDIQRMMDAVSDARTPYAMLKAIDKAMESLFEIKWRREFARMQMLTKSKLSYGVTTIDASSFLNTFVSDHKITAADARKIMNDYWRGTKANGVSVAKYIDDTTRQAMEFISEITEYAEARARFSDIKATEIIAFTRKLREKLEDYTSLNDYKLKTALANDAVRKAIIDAVDILEMYWKAQELQLSLNDDKHRRDISALEIKAKEITTQLREVNQQIKDLADGKVVVTSSGVKDRELLRKELQERYNTLLAEREEAYAEMYNAMPNIINLMQEANRAVETLLRTGKVNLAMERTKRKEHEKALIDDVLSDLASPASPQKHHIDIRNKSIFERIATGIGSVIGAPLGSMDYMLRAIGRNAPLGEGRTYNRFAYAFQKAYDNIYTALEARKKMLDDKCNILWGENYHDVHKMAESTKVMTLTYSSAINTKDGEWKPVENTTDIYVTQAMYILAMWNQAEGRVTLERQGFIDESINAVRDALNSIDPRWIEFADWVVEEYLPSGRERYNAVHRDIFGTSMAAVPNYFPIKRAKEKLQKEEDVAKGDVDLLPSTVVGAIKERASNVVPIDIETSFFEALNENTSVMEAWAEMAGLIQDINTILSNGAIKTTMLDINDTLFSDFKKAAQVATLSYIGKTPDIDKKVGTILNRLWAGSKIAFRLNTAFKQLSSALLFAGYSTDPKFQAILLWRYLGGVGKMPVALMNSIVDGTSHLTGHSFANIDIMTNIEWAKTNMPSFAKRWNEGVAGNELMARTTSGNTSWKQRAWYVKFDDAVRAVTKFGMKPNAFIDAFTSAAGARAVYDYTYEEMRKEGYSEEEAHTLAIINAEMAFNTTQQSSEGLYLAPMQMDRSVVATTLSTFMNAPYAMFRNTMIGVKEILRDAKKELAEIESLEFKKAMDIAKKQVEAQVAAAVARGEYSEEEAKKRRNELFDSAKEKIIPLVKDRAYNKYVKTQTKAVVMVFLNGYAGQVAFNLLGKLAEFMFGDDDEEKKKMLYDIAVKSAWEAPVSMMPLGGYVTSMVNGYSASFFPAMDELSKEISTIAKGLREEDISPEVIYAATTMCMRWGLGLSVDTIANVALGIESMFEDGMSAEAILKVMNAPEGQIRNIVGQRKEGETAKEYNERVMRFYSILDTPIYEDYFYTHGEKAGERRNEETPRGMFEKQMKRLKYEEAYRRSVVLHYGDGKQLAEIEDIRKAYNKLKADGYGNMHEGKREVLKDITKVINEGELALMRTVDKNEESYYSILLQVKKLQERYIELYEQFK